MTDTLEPQVIRQWISVPGTSLDTRMGHGVTFQIGRALRDGVGRFPRCLVYVEPGSNGEAVENVRRELTTVGFKVSLVERAPELPRASYEAVEAFFGELAAAHITRDDYVFAIGGHETLSEAAYVCGNWKGGVPLVAFPTTEDAFVQMVTPLGMSFKGEREALQTSFMTKRAFCDLDVIDTTLDAETSRLARVLMVSSAMAESDKSFSAVWDGARDVMDGNPTATGNLLMETLKTRGHLISSSSLALRQSVFYGCEFARALQRLAPKDTPASTLLAEGLRFAARIAAGLGNFDVDDVFTQDDLLDIFKIPELSCAIDPAALVAALKEDCFARSNRFLLALPQKIGRVRLSTVEDEVLAEHAEAWCASHAS